MSKPPSSQIPSIKLRDARENDYDFAERLYVESMKQLLTKLGAWNEHDVVSKFKEYFKLDEIQIISVNGADAGWLQLSETEYDIILDQIYIEEEFRSRGIGGRLIQDLLTTAKTKKKPILLSLLRNNPALAFYQRLGFRIVGEDDPKLHMRWDST